MRTSLIKKLLPSWSNAALALLSAVLLILAFPDFELWWTAWFALVPLMWAVEREKASFVRSFVTGWIFGTAFFFGTCWWLTFAPINYAGFPPWLAYSGMVFVALIVGVFPALFAGILSVLLRRFGSWAFLAAPFVWVFTEFLRYWVTGNNWNAIGYSQAFDELLLPLTRLGGVMIVGWACAASAGFLLFAAIGGLGKSLFPRLIPFVVLLAFVGGTRFIDANTRVLQKSDLRTRVVAVQPNVPMSGLDYQKWGQLRQHQVDLAEAELKKLSEQRITDNEKLITAEQPTTTNERPTLVILPESPMNFMYEDDREFQKFINDFARRNNVSVMFNSAEPDATNGKYFNSAVMVGPEGREVGQYDKIFLLPFGEAVPSFLEGIVPGFVGNFSYGREYDILPVGDAKAGVMICFESHFGQLSREYVRNGADVIIEMTNDGYLGPTPVLRQHLANAVFRAVETNRPVLRVTNVGITAYINERGEVLDPLPPYTEGTRVWSVAKSDGGQTFYVRYGDWFAWLCTVVTLGLLAFCAAKRRQNEA
ncbi:MAG: apolipoprotein N-acyltransferase [Pyrinomonadaceae bacterium]|nr:apolipoprotein N-acyltransferase [Pyrinomonadaceae bacterium]